MQCCLTGGVDIHHRFGIQHKPFDGCGGLPHDQFFHLFSKKRGIGEIKWRTKAVNDDP